MNASSSRKNRTTIRVLALLLPLTAFTIVLNVLTLKSHDSMKTKGKFMVPTPFQKHDTANAAASKSVTSKSKSPTNKHQPVISAFTSKPAPLYNVAHEKNINGTDVIVYLAQFGHHSSYGVQIENKRSITGASKLNRSLTTLYSNYLNDFPCDVVIFYGSDNDPDDELFKELQRGRPRLYFRQLTGKYWTLPYDLKEEDRTSWEWPQYSVGYRHMIRWYAYLIWPYLNSMGYKYVMRMDDDSYIHSRIRYNMFEYMRVNKKRYGFRQPCTDNTGELALRNVVLDYLSSNQKVVKQEQRQDYNELPELGFYSNWFICDISLFLEPPVSDLLLNIDKSKIMYTNRTGDLNIQSALVRLFLPPSEIKWFDDFSYEHVSVHGKRRPKVAGCLYYGALSYGFGSDLSEWKVVQQNFMNQFPSHCNIYTSRNFAVMDEEVYKCIGSRSVCECELTGSKCGYYMKKLRNETHLRTALFE